MKGSLQISNAPGRDSIDSLLNVCGETTTEEERIEAQDIQKLVADISTQALLQKRRLVEFKSRHTKDKESKNVNEQTDMVEKSYQQILGKDPNHVPTMNEYALFNLVVKRKYDAAEELYLSALNVSPFHTLTLCDYGFFLERIRGDFDGAEALYQRALRVDPRHVPTLANYSLFLHDVRRQYGKSLKLYNQMVKLDTYNDEEYKVAGNSETLLTNPHKQDPESEIIEEEINKLRLQQSRRYLNVSEMLKQKKTDEPTSLPAPEAKNVEDGEKHDSDDELSDDLEIDALQNKPSNANESNNNYDAQQDDRAWIDVRSTTWKAAILRLRHQFSWRPYYFVMRGTVISYFKSEESYLGSEKELGVIWISSCQIKSTSVTNGGIFPLVVDDRKMKYKLIIGFQDGVVRDEWERAIFSVKNSIKKGLISVVGAESSKQEVEEVPFKSQMTEDHKAIIYKGYIDELDETGLNEYDYLIVMPQVFPGWSASAIKKRKESQVEIIRILRMEHLIVRCIKSRDEDELFLLIRTPRPEEWAIERDSGQLGSTEPSGDELSLFSKRSSAVQDWCTMWADRLKPEYLVREFKEGFKGCTLPYDFGLRHLFVREGEFNDPKVVKPIRVDQAHRLPGQLRGKRELERSEALKRQSGTHLGEGRKQLPGEEEGRGDGRRRWGRGRREEVEKVKRKEDERTDLCMTAEWDLSMEAHRVAQSYAKTIRGKLKSFTDWRNEQMRIGTMRASSKRQELIRKVMDLTLRTRMTETWFCRDEELNRNWIELERRNVIKLITPLHHQPSNDWLKQNWAGIYCLTTSFLSASSPLDEVVAYFSEEIAFYFAFIGHYNRWLIFPAVFGAGVFAYNIIYAPVTLDSPVSCRRLLTEPPHLLPLLPCFLLCSLLCLHCFPLLASSTDSTPPLLPFQPKP
eukprot:763532-Hanusia_phi.AAC.3